MQFDHIRVRLISSDIPARLHYISAQGYILYQVDQKDLLTACFTIGHKDYLKIAPYLEDKGDTLTVLSDGGIRRLVRYARHRPVLTFLVLLLLTFTLWLPTKVLFVRIEGASAVSEQQILQCAENSGVRFGADVRAIRSERIKNSLLQQIPTLSWVGVNTKGCVATISVVERQGIMEDNEGEFSVASIVANHDAQIQEITVTAGNPLCKPGDIVSKGQVLISGYTDCGIKIQATQANGEVFGKTIHNKSLIFPAEYHAQGEVLAKNRNIFLQIGKKEIKLWKGSGISGSICDKMYSQMYLTLPGGFVLPFGIKVETCVYYKPSCLLISAQQAQPIMERMAGNDLINSMVSGKILSHTQDITQGEGVYCLTGRYVCREMVGRIQYEKIGAYHEQTSGKNRQRG